MKLDMIRVILFFALAMIGVSAQAAVTGYSDLSTWQTAVATAGYDTPDTITFAGQVGQAGNDGSTLTVSGVSFTPVTSGGAWYVLNGNYGNSGPFYSHQNNSYLHDIYVSFSSATGAVSFDAQILGDAQPVSISLSNGDSYSFTAAASAGAPVFNFGGFVDSNPFTSMHIITSNTVGPVAEGLDIQNFNVAAVPEVDTCSMLLAGFGLIGFIAYRRKNASSNMLMAA